MIPIFLGSLIVADIILYVRFRWVKPRPMPWYSYLPLGMVVWVLFGGGE